MKKIFAILSLVTFVAVNVSLAQTTQTATKKEAKTESVKPEAEATEAHSCCKKSSKACCKSEATGSEAKSCSPKAKASSAKEAEKAEAKKETKSGTN